jgi:dipeptidyl aminopeptidase/acylaminoacyl peptidase
VSGSSAARAAGICASALRIVEAGEAEVLPPLWICHPELDENVTLEMTERFVAAYRRAGGPVELEVFPDARHGFGNFASDAADRCIARMRAFIARQLAG